jgi:hypothetical protein
MFAADGAASSIVGANGCLRASDRELLSCPSSASQE